MDKHILIIKGTENQSVVAKILYESGYTVRQTTVTPKGSKRAVKALEYWKGEVREILFRGFHPYENGTQTITIDGKKVKGEWVQGLLPFKNEIRVFTTHKWNDEGEEREYATTEDLKVIPETVGEYTGLTDKNGNKIFEGDILKIISTVRGKQIDNGLGICCGFESKKREDCAIVLPDCHTGGYRLKVVHKGKYKRIAKFASGHLSIYQAEIIGNIYDNPELLK